MGNNLTELVFLLDRSGSMGGLEEDTIGGFNAMLEKQKREPGEALVTTILFDHEAETLHQRVPIHSVHPLTNEYSVRGSTALLDALGKTIWTIAYLQKKAKPEERPEKTIFVITTDGCENASREYSYPLVKQMVQEKQSEYGWEFLFLGANMDAISAAARFGIRADRAVRYKADHDGIRLNFGVVSEVVSSVRTCACISDDWKDKIEADFKKRG